MRIELEINNPYLKRGNWDAMGAKGFNEGFYAGAQAACDAKNPKRFIDELPTDEQLIIMFNGLVCIQGKFYKKLFLPQLKTYLTFTHWQPYPTLD
jgi:hypothetical protein